MATPLEQIKERLEKMKKNDIGDIINNSEGAFMPTQVEVEREEYYNKAISDIQAILPSIIQEVEKEIARELQRYGVTCPNAYGFEGRETFPDCDKCVVCRLTASLKETNK